MSLVQTVHKLSQISAKIHESPADEMVWPEFLVAGQDWLTSSNLVSLHGSDLYEAMDESAQKVISFFEAVNFYSLNINGEKPLVEGLNRRLYARGYEHMLPYLHHFLDEENKHMQYFGRFCMKYAGKVYADRKVVFPRQYAVGEEDFLFFLKVVIFEEIADSHNVLQGADQNLHAVARKINQLHHQDEARHLIFGRELVVELFDTYAPKWGDDVLQGLRSYLETYLIGTWKEYYNPDIYKDAGLDKPYELAKLAWSIPEQKARRQRLSAKLVKFLLDNNILLKEPEL